MTQTKLFADKDIPVWSDLSKLKVRLIYVMFEDDQGYLSRARGMVLRGKENDVLKLVTADVRRFLEEARKGETSWEP